MEIKEHNEILVFTINHTLFILILRQNRITNFRSVREGVSLFAILFPTPYPACLHDQRGDIISVNLRRENTLSVFVMYKGLYKTLHKFLGALFIMKCY